MGRLSSFFAEALSVLSMSDSAHIIDFCFVCNKSFYGDRCLMKALLAPGAYGEVCSIANAKLFHLGRGRNGGKRYSKQPAVGALGVVRLQPAGKSMSNITFSRFSTLSTGVSRIPQCSLPGSHVGRPPGFSITTLSDPILSAVGAMTASSLLSPQEWGIEHGER